MEAVRILVNGPKNHLAIKIGDQNIQLCLWLWTFVNKSYQNSFLSFLPRIFLRNLKWNKILWIKNVFKKERSANCPQETIKVNRMRSRFAIKQHISNKLHQKLNSLDNNETIYSFFVLQCYNFCTKLRFAKRNRRADDGFLF